MYSQSKLMLTALLDQLPVSLLFGAAVGNNIPWHLKKAFTC